jgi:membrane protein
LVGPEIHCGVHARVDAIYDIEEGRPIWMTLPVRVGVTIALLALLALSAFVVVVTWGLARYGYDPR